MVKGIILVIFLSLISHTVLANNLTFPRSIVEENDLWIGVDDKKASDMTQEEFNQILDRVHEIYAPIVKARGGNLVMIKNWESGTVNAYAQQTGRTWKVSMFGGLARHEAITNDGFAMVACHEIGHHLGGLPKIPSWWSVSWASAEGQADYYAALKCAKRVFEKDNNVRVIQEMENVDPHAVTQCNVVYENEDEAALCVRVAMAGVSLGELLRILKKLPNPVKLDTPDTTVVTATKVRGYPPVQCRLDTYFAGALCDKDPYQETSNTDINEGVCTRAEEYALGPRPLCWYKP